ncbi:hypothetical protein I3843_16G031500 [Carya illinoinensis]|nr:hypothetical protein I3843_16G031500 [Carya illinoinensis]
MKVIWAGSRHTLELSDCISRLVASDPVIFSTSSVFFFFRPIWLCIARCFRDVLLEL